MKRFGIMIFSTLGLALMTLQLSCTSNKKNSSSLAAITGVDAATGQEMALGLLPVRNYTASSLGGASSDSGVQQAAAMVKTRLLALIECQAVTTPKSGTLSASALMTFLEGRAAVDDLYVDASRHLITSADPAKLLDFETSGPNTVAVPCHLFGSRLLSFVALNDLQVRAAGMPQSLPQDKNQTAVVNRVFLLAQAIHLAARSSHGGESDAVMTPMAQAILDMAHDQGVRTLSLAQTKARLIAADKIYNPCIPSSKASSAAGTFAYMQEWKVSNFGCAAQGGASDIVNYRAGGLDGKRYNEVRDLIAAEIKRTHENVVFAGNAKNNADLAQLWDLLTSTTSWNSPNTSALAKYMTGGQGIDFAQTFATKSAGASTGLALTASNTKGASSAVMALSAKAATPAVKQRASRGALVRYDPRINWMKNSALGRSASLQERQSKKGLTALADADSQMLETIKTLGK